ncbi:response regulator [Cohnella fermenti]|nr:response regulator [Cohnella fermenti]
MRVSQARISALNILIIGVMVLTSILSFFSSLSMQQASNFVVQETIPAIQATDNLVRNLIDQETGIRGYMVTSNREFLNPYETARNQIQANVDVIRNFARAHSPEATAILERKIVPQINRIEVYLEEMEALVLSGKMEEARDQIGNGKADMDRFRDLQAELAESIEHIAHDSYSDAYRSGQTARYILLAGVLLSVSAGFVSFLMYRRSSRAEKELLASSEALRKQHDETLKLQADQEAMMAKLIDINAENERQNWLKTHYSRLINLSQGITDAKALASLLISELAKLLEAGQGVFYGRDSEPGSPSFGSYFLLGSYACTERKSRFEPGEGLIGQCALERAPIVLRNVPDDYAPIQSGLGGRKPLTIAVLPVPFENEVSAVIELSSFEEWTPIQMELLEQVTAALGVILDSVSSRQRTERLLAESRQLSELLQTQQEELRASNEELEEQTSILRLSEEKLKIQSEELQVINEEMELKTSYLELQKADIEKQNELIRLSKQEVEEKAQELELASKYKSEFLANMSHELRTPLNSLLILSKSLAGNEERNLTEDQVESARIIYSGGQDLLRLINDILDLSKVEAGKMDIRLEPLPVVSIVRDLQYQFNPVAKERGLRFECRLADDLPEELMTDGQRTEQILRNLLSNAFKFTAEGCVRLDVLRAGSAEDIAGEEPFEGDAIVFSVRDTGIGIPYSKQQAIFEAFQQADGSTSRRYGGTGLGLTISRELARLLGGRIRLASEEGQGSCFSLLLPLDPAEAIRLSASEAAAAAEPGAAAGALQAMKSSPATQSAVSPPSPHPSPSTQAPFSPTAAQLSPSSPESASSPAASERTVLIVEDDAAYAKVMQGLARRKGFGSLVAASGAEGLRLAKEKRPRAIVLDLGLPDMDGLQVLEALRTDRDTKSIPVHVVSGREATEASLLGGAVSFLAKPATAERIEELFAALNSSVDRQRRILVIEDDPGSQRAIQELLKKKGELVHSYTAAEGMRQLRESSFDVIILDLDLPDLSGMDLLLRLAREKGEPLPPIVIFTGRELTQEEYVELSRYSSSIVVKGASSGERLLDEVNLFLHSLPQVPESRRSRAAADASNANANTNANRDANANADAAIRGRRVLLVDDDLRNTFALSKILKQHGFKVEMADNGKLALERLEAAPAGIDLVLMDIMMPVMDGYEAMRRIRADERFRTLPIIALTAKAMTGDREKCIEGGANDYMTKPVDPDQLLSLLRVWLAAER